MTEKQAWLGLASKVFAIIAGLLAFLAVLGYAVDLPLLIRVGAGLEGMSFLTSVALIALAVSVLASVWLHRRVGVAAAAFAVVAAGTTLVAHIAGVDAAGLSLGAKVFHVPADAIGQPSVATTIDVLLVSVGLYFRRFPLAADLLIAAGLVISGVSVLGYFYGVHDLYALPLFNSMALNTAVALLLLSVAALLAEPTRGWAAVIGSSEMGGGATRRQLSFIVFPILAGKMLLVATGAGQIGPGLAMALLVIVTVLPLAALILRDGQVLNTLDRERRERVRAQERLTADMADQLARQADELTREGDERARAEMAMHQSQRMEAVGQLTGGIAHDFNNLLMAVRGNLELLQRRLPPGDERLHRYASNAMAATDKGAKVTAQLLAFSRSQRLNIRAVQLDPVLTSARELIGNALGPDIRLDMQLESGGAWVMGDPDQLELAILNLAVNSRDAMPQGGRIRIESAVCDALLVVEGGSASCVAIRVKDEGSGMTPEVAAQAIEPFFTTKERGKGTGLGLAQVYGFVRQCGGDLRIISAPREGTTIEILLRRAAPALSEARPTTISENASHVATPRRQVLVIDDDEGVRAVIVDALTTSGFEVSQAADGETGLAMLRILNPAAAVIDFLMPGMNGAEVARIAQKLQPGLPIVFVSGYSDTVALDGIAGAVVLRKPFDMDGLNRALASVMP